MQSNYGEDDSQRSRSNETITEESHIELQANVTQRDVVLDLLYTEVARCHLRLGYMDALQFDEHSTAEKFRYMKSIVSHCDRNWPDDLDEECGEHLKWILDELEKCASNALVINRLIPAEGSELAQFMAPASSDNIENDSWAYHNLIERANEKMVNLDLKMVKQTFAVIVPASYRCSNCLTNEHDLVLCTEKRKRCLRCKRWGHVSYYCWWQLCAKCKMYGHGRQRCEATFDGPACLKCGKPGHDPEECPNLDKPFCRVCGADHTMLKCPVYKSYGEPCYKHCGRHKFSECPDMKL